MGIEDGVDPDLLGTDVNWPTVHDQPKQEDEAPAAPAAKENAPADDLATAMEQVKTTPDYQTLDPDQQADVDHVLQQLLDGSNYGIRALTPEADNVISATLGVSRGYLGSATSGIYRISFMATKFPNIARTIHTHESTGAETSGYRYLEDGKKYWE